MQDRELMRMAAFKLQDTARRMKSLAREAQTPEAVARLNALADELCDMEARLWALIEGGPTDSAAGGSEADATSGERSRRRADG